MEQRPEGGELQATPTSVRLTDAELIHYNITEALREDRPIDHATARAIAAQLHGGQASALYALSSSGALVDGVRAELDGWRLDSEAGVEVEPWLDALDEYLYGRDDPARIEGWHRLWPSPPPRYDDEPAEADDERPPSDTVALAVGRSVISASVEVGQVDDEAEARDELFARINAAGVRTLGELATVDDDEVDDFSWVDAAEWRATEAARTSADEPRYPPEELDRLFTELPDAQVGSVEDVGWYGLLRHEGNPGRLILVQDQQGFRHVREASDNETLERLWKAVERDYETFHEQRQAFEMATTFANDAPSGMNPRIWVANLADYNNGYLFGAWMDATTDFDDLEAAAQFMLRQGHTPDAEEWAIFDSDDFGNYTVHEYASFRTVSRIAKGIAEHGEAFVKWVEHVGEDSEELLTDERFHDYYHGEWDSAEAYVEHYLTETDSYDFMKFVPDSIRHYVSVDVEMLARDMQMEGLLVEEMGNGKVAVFWTS